MKNLMKKIKLFFLSLNFKIRNFSLSDFFSILNARLALLTTSPDFWYLLMIFILGLAPLLWYGPDKMALGHDMGFPLDPQSWFLDRLHTWSERDTFGIDQSHMMASVILHGFEYLVMIITRNVILAQKLTYIFWFTLPGLTMYKFVNSLYERRNKEFMALISAIVYMFNLFLLQGWFIAERNKIAILAALPLVLYLILKVIRDKYDTKKAAIQISLIYLFLNGGGSIPLYGATILIVPTAFLVFSLAYTKGKSEIFRIIKFMFQALLAFILANSFWIFPLLISVRSEFQAGVDSVGGISSTLVWIGEISKEASLVNLLRGQGFPDWGNKHVYGSLFRNNLYLVITSFTFIIITFLNLLWSKTKNEKTMYTFYLMCLVLTVFFASGTHAPFGFIYSWLVENIPMFIIFRTPFYKFAGGIVFVYSYMAGFASVNFITLLNKYLQGLKLESARYWARENNKSILLLFKTMVIALLLTYTYPFMSGTFFEWNKPISTMVEVPEYVHEYGNYVNNSEIGFGRTLLIPDVAEGSSLDVTDWNYFSLNSVPSILTSRHHIGGNANTVRVEDKNELMNYVYSSLESGKDFETSAKLLGIIGVDKLLWRDDAISFENALIEEPEVWKPILDRGVYIKTERVIGKWQLYSLDTDNSIYRLSNNVNLIGTSLADFPEIVNINKVSALEIPNVFLSEGVDSTLPLVQDLEYIKMPFRELLEMDFAEANVIDGKIAFELSANKKEYEITAKSYNSAELFYNVYLSENKNGMRSITIERPEVELNIAEHVYKTISKSQIIPLGTKQPLDIIVINETVLNVTGSLSKNNDIAVGQFQPRSAQLSVAYGSSNDKEFAHSALYDPSFEHSRWGGAQICGGDIAPINVNASLSTDSTSGDFSVSLETTGNTVACLIQPMENLNPSKIYRLSFDYKNIKGFPLKVCLLKRVNIENKKHDVGCLVEKTFGRTDEWNSFTADFAPTITAEYILHFYSEPTSSGATRNLIDNIVVQGIDMSPVGAFALNTGIESSQFFEVEEGLYEELGTVHLEAENKIQLYTDGAFDVPFIEASGFEYQLWGGVNLCGGDRKDNYINVSYSKDSTEGKRSARLEGRNASACIYNSVQNFRSSLVYKLSFDYKNIDGNGPEFCALVQSDEGDWCQPSVKLPKSNEWKTYKTIIETDETSTGIIAHFYSPALDDGHSVNLFDNIKIEAAYNPLQKLFFISKLSEDIVSDDVDISVVKESVTRYSAKIDNLGAPKILSINTAYHPLWELRKNGDNNFIQHQLSFFSNFASVLINGKLSSEDPHFIVNGFENAWLIDDSGDYSVEYFPQKVFKMGLIISSCYISFLIFGYLFKKNNWKFRLMRNNHEK